MFFRTAFYFLERKKTKQKKTKLLAFTFMSHHKKKKKHKSKTHLLKGISKRAHIFWDPQFVGVVKLVVSNWYSSSNFIFLGFVLLEYFLYWA
jgi:hypothetical protein